MAIPVAISIPPTKMNGPPKSNMRPQPLERSDTHAPVIPTTMMPSTSRTTPRVTTAAGAHPGLFCWSDKRRLRPFARNSRRRRGLRLCQGGVAGGAGAVEEVVGVEGDDLLLRRHEVDAGALHAADAEIEAV